MDDIRLDQFVKDGGQFSQRMQRKGKSYQKPEAKVKKAITAFLQLKGCFVIGINSGAMQGSHKGKSWYMKFNTQEGCSDLLVGVPHPNFKHPILVCIECKAKNGKPSKKQKDFILRAQSYNVIAFAAWGIADVVNQLPWLGD